MMARLFRSFRRPSIDLDQSRVLVDEVLQTIKDQADHLAAAGSHHTLGEINRKLEKIMSTLDDLVTAVAAEKTQIDSLVALTGSLHQAVLDALGGTITPSQQMRIDAVFKAINDNAAEVAAAVTANTIQATAGAVSGGPSAADIKNTGGQAAVGSEPAVPADAPVAPPPNAL